MIFENVPQFFLGLTFINSSQSFWLSQFLTHFWAKSTTPKLWACRNIQALPHTYKKKEGEKSAPLFCWQPSYGEQFLLKKEPAFSTPLGRPTTLQSLFVYFFHLLFALYLSTEVFCGLYSLWT